MTLRTMAPAQTGEAVGSFKTVATAFTADKGQSSPAGSLTIATSALPVAVVGQTYSTTLASVGGFPPTYWSLTSEPSTPIAAPLPIPTATLPGTASISLNEQGLISSTKVTESPGAYTPLYLQVQDSAVSGAVNPVSTPVLDVQQLELDVNQFKISSVDVQPSQFENELGSAIYMKTGDSVTVAVTISNQGPVEATMVTPTLTATPTAGGTPSGPQPAVSCTGPYQGSSTIAGGSAAVTDVFDFTCTAGSGNGYVTFTANATGQYVNSAGTVNATATTATVPPTTDTMVSSVGIDNTPPTLTFGASSPSANTAGWYSSPVVIQFSTSDNLSGVMSSAVTSSTATSTGGASGSMTLTTEGNPVTGSMTATDYSRNTSAPVTSSGFKIDRTPPTISGAARPGANGAGWNNTPVTVSFTCNDPDPAKGPAGQQSQLVTGAGGCTLPVTLSGEGANQNVTGTATDNAANSQQATVQPINIDLTPPTVTDAALKADSTAYVSGTWTNQTVTVTYACSDALSGVGGLSLSTTGTGGSPIITSLGLGASMITISGETSGLTVMGACTDVAGNLTTVSFGPVMIDKTAPTISVSAITQPPGADSPIQPPYASGSWTNQDVVVTYTCTDSLSGPAVAAQPAIGYPVITGLPNTEVPILTQTDANHFSSSVRMNLETVLTGTPLSASCVDNAGNVNAAPPAPTNPFVIMIDRTPPTVTAVGNLGSSNGPAYNANTWTNQSVVVTFACSDALSGVTGSITGNTSYGSQGSYTANGSCIDNAGNTGTGSFGPVLIDTTTPSVMITAPMQTTYILNQQITPSFTCGDGSGGDTTTTCTAMPSASPYTASAVGPSTFTVNAVDQANNSSSASVSYLVTYKFTGFQAPLQNAVMTPYPSGSFTPSDSGYFAEGATIPVAWQLQDAMSTIISDPTTLTSIVAYPNATCAGPASGNGTILYNSSTNTSWFGYANNTFTFSWNTTGIAVGCYNLVVTTNDTAQWSTIVHLGQSFAVGTTPYAIAFDGTNMWVADYGSNNVTELQASTGGVLGTFPVGAGPDGVFFDGTNIWVANTSGNTVTKLSANGTTLGMYPVGSQPWGIASDGVNIWVTNRSSNTVTKLLASTGANVGTYAVGSGPYGIAFDGTNMWVANDYDGTVTELVASTGALVKTYTVGASPVGVAFDGTNIWVADQTAGVGTVTEFVGGNGSIVKTYPAGPAPNDVLFDGTNIWVTNNSSNTVTELATSTGAIVGTFAVGTGPYGIAFDGTNIWVTNPGNNSVTKLPAF